MIEHPDVVEAAVVGSPDPIRGQIVKAFVVLSEDRKRRIPSSDDVDDMAEELKTHVKTMTAAYKYPRKIEFVDNLPKTISGKIRRVELRMKEWADAA